MSPVPRSPEPTAPNPSTAAARVLLDELARCGVRHVVMAPGSRSTALVVAAHDHPGLLLHVEVDERSAGFLAVGIGRSTGEPAAVVVTSGTAVANLLPAVVEADHDRVPLLLLTADRPPELHGTGANQTIRQLGIFGDSPRWTVDLGVPGGGPEEVARWRWTASRAHGVAVGRPVEAPAVVGLDAWREPGPVHCNLPFREPTVPVTDDGRSTASPFHHPLDGRADGAPWATPMTGPTAAGEHAVQVAAEALASTGRGLVVVGAATAGPLGPVAAVAERLGWPLLAEPHGGGRTGDALRGHGLVLGARTFLEAHEPRLVLRLGRVTVGTELGQLLARTPQVVVDEHGGWVDAAADHTTLVRGDVEPTLHALLAALDGHRPLEPDWAAAWQAAGAAASGAADELLDAVGALTEPRSVRDVAAAVPPGGALVVGSSMPIRDLDLLLPPRDDLTVHANRGASGIDGFTSTALGVALTHDGPTVAVCGDLTLLHDGNGWLLSPDPACGEPDLVLVVLDNDGGGIFSFLPQHTHVAAFERLFGTPHGRDPADLARLHGLTLHRPTSATQVPQAVAAAIAAGGRHLVHVRTDREHNLELHAELRAAAVAAVTAAG